MKRQSKFDNGDESFSAREQEMRLHPANNLGYVNYINGVPVSIQLNNTNDFLGKVNDNSLLSEGFDPLSRVPPPNSWK